MGWCRTNLKRFACRSVRLDLLRATRLSGEMIQTRRIFRWVVFLLAGFYVLRTLILGDFGPSGGPFRYLVLVLAAVPCWPGIGDQWWRIGAVLSGDVPARARACVTGDRPIVRASQRPARRRMYMACRCDCRLSRVGRIVCWADERVARWDGHLRLAVSVPEQSGICWSYDVLWNEPLYRDRSFA